MAKKTKISWAHSTFNPWIGCDKVSPACDHCYAEGVAKRMGKALWGKDAGRMFTSESYWREPLSWERQAAESGAPWRVFCGSLCDVMEDRRDLDERRTALYELVEATPHLTWLLLSKRPENFVRLTPARWSHGWPANVWPMTTAENQRRLNERLPSLLCVPAEVRGLSIEPMLGPIEIPEAALPCVHCQGRGWYLQQFADNFGTPCKYCKERATGISGDQFAARQTVKFRTISWVICGGESGGGARPMHPAWAKLLRDQCVKHGVAFHFKQWGEWVPISDCSFSDSFYLPPRKRDPEGPRRCKVAVRHIDILGKDSREYTAQAQTMMMFRAGTKRAGRQLDGVVWEQTPESELVRT